MNRNHKFTVIKGGRADALELPLLSLPMDLMLWPAAFTIEAMMLWFSLFRFPH